MSEHQHHAQAHDHDDAELAELLDLDGDALRGYWTDAVTWVRGTVAEVSRIADLGAGTGTGSFALADVFPAAEVFAVDSSATMLARLRAGADRRGVADRMHVVHADLDTAWPDLGALDLTWASMSLHHVADPDRVLRDISAATRPGGAVAVAEFVEPLHVLAEDVGTGLEARCLESLGRLHELPELGSDWASRLVGAGFDIVGERDIVIDLRAPDDPASLRYAGLWLQRLLAGVGPALEPRDLVTLRSLVELGVESRDVHLHGTRTVTVARRP